MAISEAVNSSWAEGELLWFRVYCLGNDLMLPGVTRRYIQAEGHSLVAGVQFQLKWKNCVSSLESIPSSRHEEDMFSVKFSHSVVPDSLWPHELNHTKLSCPSLSPGVRSNSYPSSQWRHATISCFVIPFSSCSQSLPASESFPVSQLFAWGGQSTGVSALASFFPKNTQDWSPLGWTGWIPRSPRDSQESSPTPQFKSINSLVLSFLHSPTLTPIHDHWKNHSLG